MTGGDVVNIRREEFAVARNDSTTDDRVTSSTGATSEPRLHGVTYRSRMLDVGEIPHRYVSHRADGELSEFSFATETGGALPRRHLKCPAGMSSVSPAVEFREQHRLTGLQPH